ncbi:MAG: N-6 DNA methylase [Deltaproteobacteria bacterium]|nr:N-6 DNA methylase [Deltaproteobacteria bacterium]
MNLTTIHSEGSLISADLLAEIQAGVAYGQKAGDFGLDGGMRLTDEIAACWSDARAYWEAFQHGLRRVREEESGAGVTREQWIMPLLRSLGFEDVAFARSAAQVGGQSYFISHRAGPGEEGLPVHIEGARNELDRRPPTGRPRISPHALVQEYLNRTEHLWGVVTNGCQFRILRDSARLSRPTYLEFDLEGMMEGGLFAEFQIFYRIAHRSRWPEDVESAHECLLEQYYQQGIESGGRVRERLRGGVEEALKIFGNGFLSHPDNSGLRRKIQDGRLDAPAYYSQLLRLIYRLLFLMVSEERRLVGPDPRDDRLYSIYHRWYSISRLREKACLPVGKVERHWDLWEGVRQTFRLYCDVEYGKKLGVAPLNGDLFGPFAMPDIEDARLSNRDFLRAFAHLSLFRDERVTRRINYGHLDVEELGSVYESLLDYHPVLREINGKLTFELAFGTERKSTGSYYTRPELVHELIKSALEPVMEERLRAAGTREEKIHALLSLKVCDPAAGSGHFLLAAARRIGTELAKVRTGEEQAAPEQFRLARREVIRHCIYGVDVNPLAVDLCKVALWLEGHSRGLPLTFLDNRIKCGNSLIGLDTLERLKEGIPDNAFKPVAGDDREVAKKIRALNRAERKDREENQMTMDMAITRRLDTDLDSFASHARAIGAIVERAPEDVSRKQEQYEKTRADRAWHTDWRAANIWTAAFFHPLASEWDPAIPTHERLMKFLHSPGAADGRLVGAADALAAKLRFFHWPLEFPEVMKSGGFDVVLGNPPWERIKLQEQEFFAIRAPEIARAPNRAARERMIGALKESNPDLAGEFEQARHHAEANSRFVRACGRFPLTAVGDVNTYALFAELSRRLLRQKGRAGIIVPTGIATDDTCKRFFGDVNAKKALVSLYDFENREKLFPDVDSRYKFCLFTTSRTPVDKTRFSFFLTRTAHLDDELRRFALSPEDIALINPNTRTTPVFRTRVDAGLTKKIYRRVPVLVNERTGENPWGVSFMRMIDMANDSHLFYTGPGPGRVPLYEAKMIWQFDHRFGTYEGADRNSSSTHLPIPKPGQYADPNFVVRPRYWVDEKEVEARLAGRWNKKWLMGFRDITNATNERTAVFSLVPRVGVGNNTPLLLLEINKENLASCILANFNSLVFDFVNRQKIAGTHMNFFFVKQLPVLPPEFYKPDDIEFIAPRVLELIYTTWDMKPFAEDCGYDGPPFIWEEERRALLRAELDAYYAHLYGLSRDELRYILDPQDVYGPSFPGETFRVLKEKEIRKYGEYRTRRLVLEAWDRLSGKDTLALTQHIPPIHPPLSKGGGR